MSLFGLGNSLGRGAPAIAAGFAISAYFYACQQDKKLYKISPAGVITVFKDYTSASREPFGCAVDSINGRLFVMMGDTAGEFQVDRFDDLSLDTGATAAVSVSAHTAWGGEGFYWENKLYWFTPFGTVKGFHRMDDDLTNYTTLVNINFIDLTDGQYWPPDTEVYGVDTDSTDQLASGELDGTSWTNIGGSLGGFLNSLIIPPAYLMGDNDYIIFADTSGGNIHRSNRAAGSKIIWLAMAAASTIKLLPRCVRFDYVDNKVVFVGHDNAGTGVFGLWSIPLQEAAQDEANLTLIANFATASIGGNQASKQGMAIHYSQSEVDLMIDVVA